jgi:phage antirepressor YoqD-like protein
MSTCTTVQQLADHLDIDEKRLRGWLRQGFPKQAPGKGGRWVLTSRMNDAMAHRLKAFNKSRRDRGK